MTNSIYRSGVSANDFAVQCRLCPDVMGVVCQFLNASDVSNASSSCKAWKFCTQRALVEKRGELQTWVRTNAFGSADWQTHFGTVPSLRLELRLLDILKSECPFNPGKTVAETHILFLLPTTVNGTPHTATSIEGANAQYRYFNEAVEAAFGETPPEQPCWVLMTRDVIPGSRGQTFATQQSMVHVVPNYEVPTMLAAITAIFTRSIKRGEMLYPDATGRADGCWTFTRCQERLPKSPWQVVVGGLGGAGLYVDDSYIDFVSPGVGALRKFSGT